MDYKKISIILTLLIIIFASLSGYFYYQTYINNKSYNDKKNEEIKKIQNNNQLYFLDSNSPIKIGNNDNLGKPIVTGQFEKVTQENEYIVITFKKPELQSIKIYSEKIPTFINDSLDQKVFWQMLSQNDLISKLNKNDYISLIFSSENNTQTTILNEILESENLKKLNVAIIIHKYVQ